MSRSITSLVATLGLLAAPSAAQAVTLPESLAIADQFVAEHAPGKTNHCAGGKLQIEWQDQPHYTEGTARFEGDGATANWVLVDNQWVWDTTRCHIIVKRGLTPARTCWVIAHELFHVVNGPEHIGPIAPDHEGAADCNRAPEPPPMIRASAPPAARTASKRERLLINIRRALPRDRAWTIKCGPNHRRMRCSARSRKSVRYFKADIRTGRFARTGR